ncbi:hypothetical protein Bbelb_362880 [Branchiostoma belcheri]|nr:hypothetical protein Bbelb_362880 [Branchiostoma belcheri]
MVATEYLFCGKVASEETRWHLDFTELIPRSPTIRMRNEKLIQFPANSHDMTAARQEERNPARTTGKPRESQRVGRRQNIDKRLWIYVSFSATLATVKLTIYKLCDSNHLNWTCTSLYNANSAVRGFTGPAGWMLGGRQPIELSKGKGRREDDGRRIPAVTWRRGLGPAGPERRETRRRGQTNHSEIPGTFLVYVENNTTFTQAQIVHVKPPPDTPSSFEATDVYIPGPETSVPDPDRTVGRGQKVSLRRVPVAILVSVCQYSCPF